MMTRVFFQIGLVILITVGCKKGNDIIIKPVQDDTSVIDENRPVEEIDKYTGYIYETSINAAEYKIVRGEDYFNLFLQKFALAINNNPNDERLNNIGGYLELYNISINNYKNTIVLVSIDENKGLIIDPYRLKGLDGTPNFEEYARGYLGSGPAFNNYRGEDRLLSLDERVHAFKIFKMEDLETDKVEKPSGLFSQKCTISGYYSPVTLSIMENGTLIFNQSLTIYNTGFFQSREDFEKIYSPKM